MSKKFFFATIVCIILAQASPAQFISTAINHTNCKLMLNDTSIWIEDASWNKLQANGKVICLYLDETNPVFFALVYNTLKDHMISKKNLCSIFTQQVTSPVHGTYAKITQIYFQ